MQFRIDPSKIYPKFLDKCEQLLKNCEARGAVYIATSGFRPPEEQEKLYAIGRTEQLDKRPVTNAKPYTSWHNYGLAIDFTFDKDINKPGLQPSWNEEDYKILAEEAKKLGLTAGFYWNFKDPPHIQYKNSLKLSDCEKLYKSGGLTAIWEKLN